MFEKDINELSYRVRKYGWIWLRKIKLMYINFQFYLKSSSANRILKQNQRSTPSMGGMCQKKQNIN